MRRSPPTSRRRRRQLGLTTARLTTTLSAIFNGDANQLANVRAVSEGYPLRGHLSVADRAFAAGTISAAIPAPGEVWPDSRVAAALGATHRQRTHRRHAHAARHAHPDLAPRPELDLR